MQELGVSLLIPSCATSNTDDPRGSSAVMILEGYFSLQPHDQNQLHLPHSYKELPSDILRHKYQKQYRKH
jgi:hypothetical protein